MKVTGSTPESISDTATSVAVAQASKQTEQKAPSNFWRTARSNMRLRYALPPIQVADRSHPLPLSHHQERLWSLEQLYPGTSVHNLLHTFRLVGELNVSALEKSLNEIVQRHEVLRTSFQISDGHPVQVIHPDLIVKLDVTDLQHVSSEQQEQALQALVTAQTDRPFDLTQAPLWRFVLVKLSEQEYVLLRTIHHMIFDGWSHNVFLRELGVLYDTFSGGQANALPELPVQYVDYAQTQRQWLQGEILQSQLHYWAERFQEAGTALQLPVDRSPSGLPSYHGACHTTTFSLALTKAIKTLGYKSGVSAFDALLTAFQTLLHRYTGQEDMVICSPVAGRHRADTKSLIGYFNNILALRTDLSGDPTFQELMERVGTVTREAQEYQEVPLQMVASLPNVTRIPLTRAMFSLRNMPSPTLDLTGLAVSSAYVDREIANFDLSISMEEQAGQFVAALQYKTDLFAEATARQFLDRFVELLELLVANPEQRLSVLPQFANPTAQPIVARAAIVAPRNDIEQELVQIWETLLEIQPIGVTENFFELGGHSLLAVQLFAQLEARFGKQLPFSTLLTAPTIAQLAQYIAQPEGMSVERPSVIVPLKAGVDHPALFLIHDGDGETLLYRNLAQQLAKQMPVYGVQPLSQAGQPIMHARITDMVNYYIQEIRRVQPDGPYLLGGLCAGGVLAFEIARQLQLQGQSVAMVAIIDAADVEAEEQAGLIANQRLSRLSSTFGEAQHMKPHQKAFYLTQKIAQKARNTLLYEAKSRAKNYRDRWRLKLFQSYLDQNRSLPEFLQNIPVRTVLVHAQEHYVPSAVYQGEVVLFRATQADPSFEGTAIDDQPYQEKYSDPLLGWGRRVTGNVVVYDVPGGHSSMLQEPNVQVMARAMQAYINQSLVHRSEQPLQTSSLAA